MEGRGKEIKHKGFQTAGVLFPATAKHLWLWESGADASLSHPCIYPAVESSDTSEMRELQPSPCCCPAPAAARPAKNLLLSHWAPTLPTGGAVLSQTGWRRCGYLREHPCGSQLQCGTQATPHCMQTGRVGRRPQHHSTTCPASVKFMYNTAALTHHIPMFLPSISMFLCLSRSGDG